MAATRILTGAIYVDDSGNPGARSGSDFLPSSRKAWTAVIVPTTVASEVQEGMEIFLNAVRGEFGVNELHFTEIYSKKGLWKDVSAEERAKVIGIMSEMINAFDLPIVHQSVSDFTRTDHPKIARPFQTVEWNTEDISHFGFLVLCSEVSVHLRELRDYSSKDFNLPFPLFADEGILKAGRSRALPNWGDVIDGPEVRFRNSADIAGLQLADFAAFIINRTQWIAATRSPGPLTPAEEVILRASGTLNILNLTPQVTPVEDFGRESYEKMLSADRVAKGLAARPLSTK